MEKKYLEIFYNNKTKIKLNLKNGKFYTGTIIQLSEHSLLFLDKFNLEIPFDFDSIAYAEPIVRGGQNE
jgi:small nuclear ribonucleoprotein (snRNP)-like protein